MEIPIQVGASVVYLCGGERAYEIAEKKIVKVKVDGVETGATEENIVPFKWFSNLDNAFICLLNMKVRASEARTLEELRIALATATTELKAKWGAQ